MKVDVMIFALVFPLCLGATGWWAWRFEHRVLAVVQRSSPRDLGPSRHAVIHRSSARHPAFSTTSSQSRGAAASPVAIGRVDRAPAQPCTSVLGWDEFTLQSVVAFADTALLSCRRDHDPTERTMVLLIGDDARADTALALFDTWLVRQTALRLRPTAVNGAIEVFAGRHGAVRAGLLAA